MAAGAALGFVAGGPAGLLFAAFCLVVGLVLLVSSDAKGIQRVRKKLTRPADPAAKVLFLVKEVHARAQRAGKFQEILGPNQSGLELEVFLHCWLVNETDMPVRMVTNPELTITPADLRRVPAECVRGDLTSWRLGRLNKQPDLWDVLVIRAAQETISELNMSDPLECGVPREGWLHYRVRDLTPAEFLSATMEVSVSDAVSSTYQATANCPRHLPGRMWPFQPNTGNIQHSYPDGEPSTPSASSPEHA